MTEGSNAAVYGILLAVVMVGVAGLYFTMSASSQPNVVYVSGGGGSPSLQEASRPFSIIAKGITSSKVTGLDFQQFGKVEVDFEELIDFRGGGTVVCTAQFVQGANPPLKCNTCNVGGDIGCTIVCGDGTSVAALKLAGTLSAANCLTSGGIPFYNAGVPCKVTKELLPGSVLLNAVPITTGYYFDDFAYNFDIPAEGCPGDCLECQTLQDPDCLEDLDPATLAIPTGVTMCQTMSTSTAGICECESIDIIDPDLQHELNAGGIFEFTKKATCSTPAEACTPNP